MTYPTLDLVAIWKDEHGNNPSKTPGTFVGFKYPQLLIQLLAQRMNLSYAEVKGKRKDNRWLVPVPLGEMYRVWLAQNTEALKRWYKDYLSNADITPSEEKPTTLDNNMAHEPKKAAPSDQAITLVEQEGELLVDSRLIAERLGIDHESLMKNIEGYQTQIEQAFGIIRFEIGEILGRGRPSKHTLLNEDQATFIMTLSKNTVQVVQCKLALVQAFSKAKGLLAEKQQRSLPNEGIPQTQVSSTDDYGKLLSQFASLQLGLKDWYSKLQAFNPKIAKSMMQNLADGFSPEAESHALARQLNSYLPAHKIAEMLGFGVPDELKKDLGMKVAAAYRAAYDSDPKEEEFDYGVGIGVRYRNVYRCNDPVVIAAIQMFFKITK